MTEQRFSAIIEKSGAKWYISIPFNPNEVWGMKQRHHVRGSVNGHAIRGPLRFEDERYLLPLGEAWRRDTLLDAGDFVEVVLDLEGPQGNNLPEDVARALNDEPQARTFFESLATFYRKHYLRWIEGARLGETRAARINEMLALLKAGKKQRE